MCACEVFIHKCTVGIIGIFNVCTLKTVSIGPSWFKASLLDCFQKNILQTFY